jgi:cytochrome c-type biogenesis protein CcmF
MATCCLIFLATFSLESLFFSDNFSIAYVVSHSNRDLSTFYKIAALWAGRFAAVLELPGGDLCFFGAHHLPE